MLKAAGQWVIEEGEPTVHTPNWPAWPDIQPKGAPFQHVVPVNDLFPHVLSLADCWCHPVLDEETELVVIHNSADGREDYETGRRQTN